MERPIIQNPELDGNSFILPGMLDVGVLLFHGFTSTTVEVRPLAESLNAAGYTVAAPLLPGHGTRPEDMFKVTKDDWIGTAEQAFKDLSRRVKKIVVGGESMGCLLALHLAWAQPEILGLVLYAPAVEIKGQWRAQFIAPFKKILPKYYLSAAGSVAVSSAGQDVLPWQGYTVIPVPAAAQFYRLQRQVRRRVRHIKQPALIFQGRLDKTINPAGAESLIMTLGSQDKRLIWLTDSGHTLLLGAEHPFVYQKSIEFISKLTS